MLKRPAAPSEAVALREFVAAATITVASATSKGDDKEYNKGDKLPLNFKSPSGSSDAPPLTRSAKKTVSREKLDDAFDAQILYNI